MAGFCGDPLWDKNITWNTENPNFTECFQLTVLAWTPCIFLWLFTPVEIYFMRSNHYRDIPWSMFNIGKLLIVLLIALQSAIELVMAWSLMESQIAYTVHVVSPAIKLATFILSGILIYYQRKYGIHSSGIGFLFTLLLMICAAPQLRSEIMSESNTDGYNHFRYTSFTFYFPLVVIFFILHCFADRAPRVSDYKKTEKECPVIRVSYLSSITFQWFDMFIYKGYKRPLTADDMYDILPEESTRQLVPIFDKQWQRQVEKGRRRQKKRGVESSVTEASTLPVMIRGFFGPFWICVLIRLLIEALNFTSPFLLRLLMEYTDSNDYLWKGFLFSGTFFVTSLLSTILVGQYSYYSYIVGFRIRTALISAIYRKSLRLSNAAKKEMSSGEIVNLMAVDAQRFFELTSYIHYIYSAPIVIVVCLVLLWDVIGIATLAGFTVMILLLPLNGYISTKLRAFHVVLMKSKDERIKFLNEILNGIKVLKLYAWEKSFERVVAKVREVELKMLKRVGIYSAGVFFTFSFAPFMVALTSFATYVLVDKNNVLDADTAFVSLSLFNILRAPLAMLPMMVTLAMQAWVSVKRINKFLNLEEMDPDNVSHKKSDNALQIENGSFSWGDATNIILKDINLKVPKGKLVAIVGPVGSGKSSIISALLGEMERVEGTVNTFGTTAYVPQQAWIQNVSLQNNIVFGKALNERLYQKVLSACALQSDIAILPGGDQTEIGEKGINLSGGQKQRVSLARAVYSGADCLLLDDPLSAVDAHVGKHIFENVLGPNGILNSKTRLLVTHGVTFLAQVDYIYVIKNGEITESGSYPELVSQKGAFSEFIAEYSKKTEEVVEDETDLELLPPLARSESTHSVVSSHRSFKRQTSKMSNYSGKSKDTEQMKLMELTKNKSKLINEEESETGRVNFSVYLRYFKSVGYKVSILVILLNFLNQALNVVSSIWLTVWAGDKEASTPSVRNMYLAVYGSLGTGQAIALFIGSVYLAIGAVYASRNVHADLLARTFRLPMSFFDTTPLGRIVNRFSKDIDVLDTVLPSIFRGWMLMMFNVLSIIVVICFSTPLFIVVIIPIAVIYYFIQKFYIATSRQLKRIESVTRSPIYSHFGETLSGQSSIRAYGEQDRFIAQSADHVDFNQACTYPSVIAQRWLALRLEAVGSFIILFATLFAVLGRENLSPAVVGLSISYALQVTSALSYLVRMTADLESNIVAVERIEEYSNQRTEAPYEKDNKINRNWPEVGRVEFKDFKVRYREGLDLVLNGVSFVIEGNQKVGIVGRTGAGKSSLTLALFRIIEAAGGKIIIDGTDISTLGLRDLRSRLTIIPQDPVLFSGTVRMNIDPFEAYTDDQIWHALEHSYLKEYVAGLTEGLQHKVSEGGENLSVGQRQLICLARALLRKTKVLILDEATAAIDLETDELIQKTIRTEFKDCTILTIAHRLNTIFDSDKVIVLDRGIIAEFDSPENLLKNENGIFYGLARESGLT